MATPREKLASLDPVWEKLRLEAEEMSEREPALAGFVHATVLQHARLEDARCFQLAKKLGNEDVSPLMTRETFEEAIAADPTFAEPHAQLAIAYERQGRAEDANAERAKAQQPGATSTGKQN